MEVKMMGGVEKLAFVVTKKRVERGDEGRTLHHQPMSGG